MVFFEKEWYISSYASIYFPFLNFFSTFFAKGIPSEKLLQGFAGGWVLVSMEVYLENSHPTKGGFHCLVCDSPENIDC